MGRIVTLRPNGMPNASGGYWFRYPGSTAMGSGDWTYLQDNDDGTYLYGIMDVADTFEVDFATYALAGNERCAAVRLVQRIAGTSDTFQFNLDTWVRPNGVLGDAGGANYNGVYGRWSQVWNPWYWTEFSQAAINSLRGCFRKNSGGVTTPAVSEAYMDLDIRTQPTVSISSPSFGARLAQLAPTISWSYNSQGDTVNAWRMKVFTAATVTGGGFNADTSPTVYDTGRVGGAATQQTVGTNLTPGGSYYAYVQLATDFYGDWWSPWASVQFYIKALPAVSAIGTSPATPITTTMKPNITGTYTDPDAYAAAALQFKVFSDTQYNAAGFNPDTSAAVWDSGSVTTGLPASGTTFSYQVGQNLSPNVNYKAYVRAAAGAATWWGAWVGMAAAFVITTAPGLVYDPPAQPRISSALADQTTQRVAVTIEGGDNLMNRNQASGDTGTLGWSNDANATLTRDTTISLQGGGSLKVVAIAAGNVAIATPSGLNGMLVQAGRTYIALGTSRPGSTARTIRLDIRWYDAAGALLSTTTGATVTQLAGQWLGHSVSGVAPTGAVYAAVVLYVLAAALGEAHNWDNMGLFPGTSGIWYRGGLLYDTRYDLIDAFGRADSATSLGTADQGGAWTAQTGTWGISGSRAYLASGAAASINSARLTSTQLADGYVQADITLSTVRASAGLIFHALDASNYLWVRLTKNATSDVIDVYKNVAGTLTLMASQAGAGLALGTTYTVRVEFYGGQLLVYINGALRISYLMLPAELNQFGSYGSYGMMLSYDAANAAYDDGGTRWDNFRAGRADATNRITVERSVDGGVTWAAMRGGVAQNWPGQKATLYDYEVPTGALAKYRAYTTAQEAANVVTSAYAAAVTQDVALTVSDWWLIDPLDPTRNAKVIVAPPFRFTRKEPQAVFDPLGRATSVVVSDGQKGIVGTVQLWAKSKADYDAINTVLAPARTLLLKDPLGRSWYVKFGDAQEWELVRAIPAPGETTPIRHFHAVTLPFAEVAAPAVV